MDNEILELLKELKEGQEEINLRLEQFKQSQIRIENEIDDINRSINMIQMVTSKNWIDVIHLKQWRDGQQDNISCGEHEITAKNDIDKIKKVVSENSYEISNLKTIVRERNMTDSLKFVKHKISELEKDVFLVKEKVIKQE